MTGKARVEGLFEIRLDWRSNPSGLVKHVKARLALQFWCKKTQYWLS